MSNITFVLPGDYRSGGVRVTVIMANLLLERGHRVRIACPKKSIFTPKAMWNLLKGALFRANRNAGWLHQFKGEVESYLDLDELNYESDEVVIAVGTYMVGAVRAMNKPVVKVRFNHGFPARPNADQEAAWRGWMPTITVSSTLIPRLQEQTEGSVWGVVPNGIDTSEYFPDERFPRDGIGALYNPHPNKTPEDLRAVLKECHVRWPDRVQRVFSTEARPPGLEHTAFTRLPPVDRAREIYSRSKVWLLTSKTEGLPGVVLEAMACGCVVVSSNNQGSLEILREGENGLIVPHGDIEGFIAASDRVMSDENLRQRLSEGAMETVRGFTWQRAADRMESFLREVPAWTNPVVSFSKS